MDVNTETLTLVIAQLEKDRINYALGGSGLLFSLGLTNDVRDWDLTTDAPLESLLRSLEQFHFSVHKSGDYPFGTNYKLVIQDQTEIEVIGGFSIYNGTNLCKLPTIPTTIWNGIKVGSPEAWYVAYTLLGRTEKADQLYSFLKQRGVESSIIAILLKEPLPVHVIEHFLSLPMKK